MGRDSWRRWTRAKRIAIAVVLSMALVVGGLGWAAAQPLQLAADDFLLPGTVIDGVDVGGLTPDAAAAAIRGEREASLDTPFTMRWPGGSRVFTLGELGATIGAERAVADALMAKTGLPWTELAQIRWAGREASWETTAPLQHDAAAVRRWLRILAREVVRLPIDAEAVYADGSLRFLQEQPGQRLDIAASADAVLAALGSGSPQVDLVVSEIMPSVQRADLGQILLVDHSAFRLTLYDGGKIVRHWPIAIGAPRYSTPAGEYTITEKRYLPTWVNPAPTGWGRNMPRVIGPGLRNPLGLRALNWSAPGAIRFHGTADLRSIGRRASKGCVRLSNADVLELYDLVEVGTRIISVRA